MRDDFDNPNKADSDTDDIQESVASLHQLSYLESETLATEIHLLGQLRDRISSAARFAGPIQIKFRRAYQAELQQAEYLLEGFPFAERGKPLTGLLVIDRYSTVELEPGGAGTAIGQFAGERLYLTHDRKWILAERVGAYSEAKGSVSEWEATCRIVTDRSLLDHYSIDMITDGLFEATNRLWEKLTPRMEALKKRSEKARQVTSKLAQIKSMSPMRFASGAQESKQANAPKDISPVASAMGKIHSWSS